ncbi:MAG: hypothetical protein JWQ35_2651 [Bacteriovoracaceae bacterium]|nr:hypothetical protein [Bacteriovoracaceae bacterium]
MVEKVGRANPAKSSEIRKFVGFDADWPVAATPPLKPNSLEVQKATALKAFDGYVAQPAVKKVMDGDDPLTAKVDIDLSHPASGYHLNSPGEKDILGEALSQNPTLAKRLRKGLEIRSFANLQELHFQLPYSFLKLPDENFLRIAPEPDVELAQKELGTEFNDYANKFYVLNSKNDELQKHSGIAHFQPVDVAGNITFSNLPDGRLKVKFTPRSRTYMINFKRLKNVLPALWSSNIYPDVIEFYSYDGNLAFVLSDELPKNPQTPKSELAHSSN